MGQDTPRLSIVVPAFNAARTISQTLKSLQAQTLTAWEAIVVDDGSTDMTYALAKNMSDVDPRILVVRLPRNVGAAIAVNWGMQRISGRYTAALAADDYWLEDFAQMTVAALDAHPSVPGVYTDYIDWYEAEGIKRVRRSPHFNHDLLTRRDFVNFSTFVARDPIRLDPRWNPVADWDCLLRLTRDQPLIHLPWILAVRRIHGGQVSVQHNGTMVRKSFLLAFRYSPLGGVCRLYHALSWPLLRQVRK